MSDRRRPGANECWADAAYRLFAMGATTPLAIDVAITNSGLNLPDAALEDLCDAIMGDVTQTTL